MVDGLYGTIHTPYAVFSDDMYDGITEVKKQVKDTTMGKHSTHGKSIVIDDDIAVVGSYNFDCRSTYVDTETMLVVQGKEITKQLNDDFDELKTESLKVHPDGSYRSSENIKIPTIKEIEQ